MHLKNKSQLPHLAPNTYWLVVARLEPENNIDTIIEGFLFRNFQKTIDYCGKF